MIYYYVDYTSTYDGNSGIQRVTRSLAVGLQQNDQDIVYVTWSFERHSLIRATDDRLQRLANFSGPAFAAQSHAGEDLHLCEPDIAAMPGSWLLVPEVTHFTSLQGADDPTEQIIAYARRNSMRTAFIFYDLLPIQRPEYKAMAARHEAYLKFLAAADIVIPISRDCGEALDEYYSGACGLRREEGPQNSPVLLPEELVGSRRTIRSREASSSPIVILSLGTIEPRKNQVKLIEAFNAYCKRPGATPAELHLSGHLHPAVAHQVQSLIAANPRATLHGYLSDDDLASLYQRAHFTAFVSEAEGYGLPIAESLWQGLPCLCANFGSMAEIAAQGGCHVVDTRSTPAIERGLGDLIDGAELRRHLTSVIAGLSLHTWRDYAAEVLALLQRFSPRIRALVYVDHVVRTGFNTGVQRVTRQLARSLETLECRVGYVKWDRASMRLSAITSTEYGTLRQFGGPTASNNAAALGEQETWLIIPELAVHEPGVGEVIEHARSIGLKVAVVLHDMVVLHRPDIYSTATREGYFKHWRETLRADLLLPNSHATRADFLHWFREGATSLTNLIDRTITVALAGDVPGSDRVQDFKPRHRAKLHLLAVGTFEPRKNYGNLLEAVGLLRSRGIGDRLSLTIVGNRTIIPDHFEEINRISSKFDNVVLASDYSDDELAKAFSDCDATVFASFTEGFGLPIAESLWRGRPCICHNEHAIKEVAEGGGTLMVDMRDPVALADAMQQLIERPDLRDKLAREAIARPLRTWDDYGREFVRALETRMGRPMAAAQRLAGACQPPPTAPLLSISVTTFNRASWLRHTLPQILKLAAPYGDAIEVVVCDNTSTDNTQAVVAEIAAGTNLKYYRNDTNVGMLGNLGVTARHSTGRFVWVIGDDDIMIPGVIENVMEAIVEHPDIHIVYLNYSYTRFEKPEELDDADGIIGSATPISDVGPNFRADHIREFAGFNENMFTAIYACVFRRDHALGAYQLDTRGDPFSSLPTCIPSSVYALQNMMELPGYWVGAPGVVVNMNVSWLRYALLWHLERMHELYDLAEWHGVPADRLQNYRLNHVAAAGEWARAIYFQAPDDIRQHFRMQRFLERCKHLQPVREQHLGQLYAQYKQAHAAGRLAPDEPAPDVLFAAYGFSVPPK